MKTRAKTIAVVACAVAAAALTMWLAAKLLYTQDDRPAATVAEAKRGGAGKIADVGRARARRAEDRNIRKAGAADSETAAESRRRRSARRKLVRREVKDPYTPAERHLADNLQSASDDNDLDNVRRAVADIMSQKNPALKQEAISTLGFFGKDALTDLMAFLRDPSQEVVDSAIDAISSSLNELDDADNAFKAEFISSLLSIKDLCGKDAVESFSGMLESLGSSDERLAVQTIVSLVESKDVGNAAKSRLKEAYQFVTGEEYTSFEAAEKWYAQKSEEDEAEAAENAEAGGDGESGDSENDGEADDGENDGEGGNEAEARQFAPPKERK